MGVNSKISWTDHTFNSWWGCTKVSAGCANCYAESNANRWGYDIWGPGKSRRHFGDRHWNEPIRWNRKAEATGRKDRVLCGSMCDVFEDNPELEKDRGRLWDTIFDTPYLVWMLLTKRAENIEGMLPGSWPWENVWLGVSAETQERADDQIPKLVEIPADVRFVSAEPLLGPIDFRKWFYRFCPECGGSGSIGDEFCGCNAQRVNEIGWIIAGSESGVNARPMHPQWARNIRNQCITAGVPFFMKQMSGRDKTTRQAIPDDLMIREFPGEVE